MAEFGLVFVRRTAFNIEQLCDKRPLVGQFEDVIIQFSSVK